MDSLNDNETDKNNDLFPTIDKLFKINKTKKGISTFGLKKNIPNEKDKKIINFINTVLLENNINKNQILNIPIKEKIPFDGNLFSYALQKVNKSDNDNLFLIYFLKFYDDFDKLLVKMLNDEEKIFLFSQLISKINIEEKDENEILFKIGENTEKFYFLLNGSTTRLITYQYEAIMDKHEYYIYMKYIYKLDEIELFNLILMENEEIFDKYELLHFILGDKPLKYHADAIKQLKNMESSYISQRLFANKLNKNNFDNSKTIILSDNKKTLDDVIKGDYITSCLDEKIRKINVPIEEYIKNLKPIHFEEENDDLVKKRLTLFSYKIDKEVKVGEHLEELDENRIIKKSSTIVCNNHCTFGFFLKKDYLNSLKITQTKFHKNDINFLLTNELFSTLSFPEFDRNYYRLFELMKVNQNHKLFCQKKNNDYIYFLKTGEVSVSLEGNINDLYRIIGLKGGPKNRKLLDTNYIKRFFSINIDEKFFSENKNFALFKINENFPIGFEDFLDEENDYKQLFNAYCNMDSEILAIKKGNFEEITYREREIYKIKEKYLIKRKKLLIDKLNTLKNGLIQKYMYEEYKIKITLPDLFEESPLSPKKNRNLERYFNISPRRKNDLLYIETKVNGKSYREITSALKLKYLKDSELINTEQNENSNNINEDEDKAIIDKTINEEAKGENNEKNVNKSTITIIRTNTINKNKIRKRRGSLKTIRIKDTQKDKFNKELLEILKTPNFNQLIRIQKTKKESYDPLDRIYKGLKNPSVKNCKSIKNLPSLRNKNNYIYEITTFNVLTPIKPLKFIPQKRKIILPQKDIGFFNNKMKEIKVNKTISQDKSSVILKTEIAPHDKYYDRNNMLISTINFNENIRYKPKKKPIFNNIHINQSINYSINKSIDKKNSGTSTLENNQKNQNIGKTLIFPTIINTSINRKTIFF